MNIIIQLKTIHIVEGSGRGSGRVRLFVGNRGSGRVNVSAGRVGSKKSDPRTTLLYTADAVWYRHPCLEPPDYYYRALVILQVRGNSLEVRDYRHSSGQPT